MKIFFCTNNFDSSGNGPAKFAKILTQLWEFDNLEIIFFTEDCNESGKYIRKVPVRKNWLSKRFGMLTRSKDYYLALLNEIKNNNIPDVIVFNNAIIGIQSYCKLPFPCIGMINDYASIDSSLNRYGLSKKYIRHKVFKRKELVACSLANLIITNSNYLTNRIIDEYNIKQSKLKVLYKGINIKSRNNNTALLDKSLIKVLFVKTDWIRGGLDILINALSSLRYDFELNIVGPPLSEKSKIKSLYKGQNISFIFHGQLCQKDIFRLLREVDVFCTPSRQEALGVANMEALIHRVPVVYSNIGGIPEVMNFGQNGFGSFTENSLSLASAVLECIDKDKVRNEKITAGYTFVKANFDKNRMIENFIKICKSAISV